VKLAKSAEGPLYAEIVGEECRITFKGEVLTVDFRHAETAYGRAPISHQLEAAEWCRPTEFADFAKRKGPVALVPGAGGVLEGVLEDSETAHSSDFEWTLKLTLSPDRGRLTLDYSTYFSGMST
jgi:hypothetical protein